MDMTVSDEMLMLYEAQRRSHETILALQAQIEEEEAVYLEETPHGNIIRGWDGFIDSKQPRKDANPKKIKPYTESEHLFSTSCSYSTMASEPSLDFCNMAKDENPNRRKLTVTLSVGKGTSASGSISGVVESATSHCTSVLSKGSKVNFMQTTMKGNANHAAEKEGTASSYQAKLKKRKKETESSGSSTKLLLETVAAATVPTSMETMTPVTATASAEPPASDFLDVL